jgi:hypothetical protein
MKLRGGRRYFRSLASWHSRLPLPQPGEWHDMWHRHPDFRGWSRKGGRSRRTHLVALFRGFDRLLQATETGFGPIQIFITVYERDSAGDAIYVHTPNPAGTPFPYLFDGHQWDVALPSWLAPHVRPAVHRVAGMVWEGDHTYSVVARRRQADLAQAHAGA